MGADRKTILPKLDYAKGKLVSIDFSPSTRELELNGTRLFKLKPKERIEQLTESSDTVFQSFNGYIFLDFGLSMASAENARSNPTICVFAKGDFDSLIKEDLDEEMGRYIKGGPIALSKPTEQNWNAPLGLHANVAVGWFPARPLPGAKVEKPSFSCCTRTSNGNRSRPAPTCI